MADNYHKHRLGNRTIAPETQMMGFGYDPHLSEGALKPPIFLTSTFVFKTAQDGKDFFDYTSGRKQPPEGKAAGLVYSRFNNPNMEVLEDRLALWDHAESAAVFSSGMSAIVTAILAFVRPGDVLLHSQPLYGGTETMVVKVLPNFGIFGHGFADGMDETLMRASADAAMAKGRVSAILLETPANPTNALVDFAAVARVADYIADKQQGVRPVIMNDNTFLGPVFQQPLQHGVDLALYSLTKYVGGHSDLVAGGVTGNKEKMKIVRALRSAIGTQLDANTSWMIMRSMETMSLRMGRAAENAQKIADWLAAHPKIASVNYLGHLKADDPRHAVHHRQSSSAGSTFAFVVKGGEAEAFRLLDAVQIMKLAVSLGGTETLISHPASTTHSGVPKELRDSLGVTDGLIRISVGIENADDLIADLEQALAAV
jgi:methionine-gamma-lyase